MATLPIYLEVEDVAFGPVLIALRKMPGIIKLNLPDPLAGAPTPTAPKVRGGPNNQEILTALLIKINGGPVHLDDIVRQTGLPRGTTLHGALNALMKKKVVQSAGGRGMWEMTAKAKRELLQHAEAPKLLPKPKAKGNGKAHAERHAPGVGRKLLLDLLQVGGALTRAEVREHMASHGLTDKAVANLIDRAKHAGLLKKVGDKYDLSASGKKRVEASAAEPATETTTQGD